MKIREFAIAPSKFKDTTSCDTTSSGRPMGLTQDIVPEMVNGKVLEQSDHSAISEGVSQIFRRKASGAPTKGFRCTSGPRKGRIVAKPATCFAKLDPVKGAKIKKKRQIKAKQAGVKMGIRKRSGPGSLRLKGAQIKRKKGSAPAMTAKKPLKSKSMTSKSKFVKPKK